MFEKKLLFFFLCGLFILKTSSYDCYLDNMKEKEGFISREVYAFLQCLSKELVSVPDDDLTTPQFISKAGYTVEIHQVKTADGYILTLERIPGTGKPVLIQHGLFGSSAGFVLTGKDHALAYLLADQNYDVWMGNLRGSIYSLCHANMSTESPKYWDFSFHEIGVHDVASFIAYIYKVRQEKMLYVGHSMGTTAFFVMASLRPDIAEKVEAMFALAPVAFMDHLETPARLIAPFNGAIKTGLDAIGQYNFLPLSENHKVFVRFACDFTSLQMEICLFLFHILVGFSPIEANLTYSKTVWNHIPAGSSAKTLTHYSQEIVSGHFRQFDHGETKNKEIYNSSEPPDYDLSKIKTPVALLYSENDFVASLTDVHRLEKALPNVILSYLVPFRTFNHLDFLWGIHAKQVVFDKLIATMDKYK